MTAQRWAARHVWGNRDDKRLRIKTDEGWHTGGEGGSWERKEREGGGKARRDVGGTPGRTERGGGGKKVKAGELRCGEVKEIIERVKPEGINLL